MGGRMQVSLDHLTRESRFTRRELLRMGFGAAGSIVLLSLLEATGSAVAAPKLPRSVSEIGGLEKLIAAAKKEGALNTIALPPDWANYGEIMQRFTQKYGIKINNASPNASSAEELQAVRSLKGRVAPQMFWTSVPPLPSRASRRGCSPPTRCQPGTPSRPA